MSQFIHVVDSHTAGEPTRVIVDGGPDLGGGTVAEQLDRFRESFDHVRTGVVREPRGSDVLVGALLCESSDDSCDAGVIFFNNVGFLGMCGHGLIGVVETLRHLGRLTTDTCRIETPVGVIAVQRGNDRAISIQNVASYRVAKEVRVKLDGVGVFVGDVAWGGNWFYLVNHPKTLVGSASVKTLQELASRLRLAINEAGYPEVDHVELFGPPMNADSDSRNFVLCPGLEYDRSPCGTGTSAKLACLAADGKLKPGETWMQEGILGTCFRGSFQWIDESKGEVLPTITGQAFVTSEAKLIFGANDPFNNGII